MPAADKVRARFTLNSFTTELHTRYPHRTDEGKRDYDRPERVEKRTLNFTPVGDESPETRQFWEASPTGSLQLGVVNQEAWEYFELGQDYYLDFHPVPDEG